MSAMQLLQQLAEYQSQLVTWNIPRSGIAVYVKAINIRYIFGRVEVQITPSAGTGTIWVQQSALQAEAAELA